jgi:hypothetical protein
MHVKTMSKQRIPSKAAEPSVWGCIFDKPSGVPISEVIGCIANAIDYKKQP